MTDKYYQYLKSNLHSRIFIPIELNFQGKLKYSKYYSFINEFLEVNLSKLTNNFNQTIGKRKSIINPNQNYIEVNYSENSNPLADTFKCIDAIVNCDKK